MCTFLVFKSNTFTSISFASFPGKHKFSGGCGCDLKHFLCVSYNLLSFFLGIMDLKLNLVQIVALVAIGLGIDKVKSTVDTVLWVADL